MSTGLLYSLKVTYYTLKYNGFIGFNINLSNKTINYVNSITLSMIINTIISIGTFGYCITIYTNSDNFDYFYLLSNIFFGIKLLKLITCFMLRIVYQKKIMFIWETFVDIEKDLLHVNIKFSYKLIKYCSIVTLLMSIVKFVEMIYIHLDYWSGLYSVCIFIFNLQDIRVSLIIVEYVTFLCVIQNGLDKVRFVLSNEIKISNNQLLNKIKTLQEICRRIFSLTKVVQETFSYLIIGILLESICVITVNIFAIISILYETKSTYIKRIYFNIMCRLVNALLTFSSLIIISQCTSKNVSIWDRNTTFNYTPFSCNNYQKYSGSFAFNFYRIW